MSKENLYLNLSNNKRKKIDDSQLNLYETFDEADKSTVADKQSELSEQPETYDFEAANIKFKKNYELSEMKLKEREDKIIIEKYAKLNGKSFKEIAEEAKKEEIATAEKLEKTRQEIKKEIEYPEKPISADDDFIEPYSPAEEYYGRWK